MSRVSVADLRDALLDGAACLFDPELHDGPAGDAETPEQRAAREQVAIEVCAACPLLAECERYAAQVRPVSGVWAGRRATERAVPELVSRNALTGGVPCFGKSAAFQNAAVLDDAEVA